MASIVAPAGVALALAPAFSGPAVPHRLWALGALCAMVPDADVAGFALGVPYEHPLGHRGLTHSLAFAALLAALVAAAAFRSAQAALSRWRVFAYLFLATASHGLFDAATNGGLGVAFFAPFEGTRYFLPFRPIQVSPIGVARFLSERGVLILVNEAIFVGVPCLLFAAGARAWRRRTAR